MTDITMSMKKYGRKVNSNIDLTLHKISKIMGKAIHNFIKKCF